MASFSIRTTAALLTFCALSFSALAQTSPVPVTPAPTTPAQTTMPATTASTKLALLSPKFAPSDYQNYLKQRYANDREALAVIHLFGRKKAGGFIWSGVGTSFLLLIATQSGTNTTSSGGTYPVTVSPVGYIAFVGLPFFVGISKLARFNTQALYNALLEFDKTGTVPGYVATRLRDRDSK